MLSNAFFKPSVQTQSVSALEMAPAVQQLMGRYHLLYQGSRVHSSASHVCIIAASQKGCLKCCLLTLSTYFCFKYRVAIRELLFDSLLFCKMHAKFPINPTKYLFTLCIFQKPVYEFSPAS